MHAYNKIVIEFKPKKVLFNYKWILCIKFWNRCVMIFKEKQTNKNYVIINDREYRKLARKCECLCIIVIYFTNSCKCTTTYKFRYLINKKFKRILNILIEYCLFIFTSCLYQTLECNQIWKIQIITHFYWLKISEGKINEKFIKKYFMSQ